MNVRRHLPAQLVVLLVVLSALAVYARAGSIELKDGTIIEGTVNWSAEGKLVIAPTGKPSQSFEVANVVKAVIDLKPIVEQAPAEPEWLKREIGRDRQDSSAAITAGRITIHDNSVVVGLRPGRRTNDSFYFVYQKLDGDGEIISRVVPKDEFRLVGRSCIMMRDSLEPGSAMVYVSRGGNWNDTFSSTMITRERTGEQTVPPSISKLSVLGAAWLKLARSGDTITAYDSADGKKWNEIGSSKITLSDPRSLYVGVAYSTGEKQGVTVFDKAAVTHKRVPAIMNNLPLPDSYALTRSGSVIAGPMVSCSATEFKISRGDVELNLPVKDLALYQIAPLSRELTDKLLKSPAGVMTKDGDFIEGEIKRIADAQVRISSIEFGITDLDQWKAAAFVFAPVGKSKGDIEVRLQDKSVFQCRSIAMEKGELVIDDMSAGTMKISPRQVLYIERRSK